MAFGLVKKFERLQVLSKKDLYDNSNNIKNLKDPFNRDLNLKKIEIDETYPEYIQKNKELYQEWILQ